ncbi:MAG: PspC domain-containing protein [Flammeovirgaceae bacterium]|nr:PspC domain-containing protein [Flammeovirgaceae bacterium]MDW8288204.1 PspC domain-containing protein [Flammeovirgaceae bacterium]
MKKIVLFFEKQAFGVCSRLGELLGISSHTIRLYFVYTSFITFGSPVIIYLFLAFWMNLRKYMRRGTAIKETIF